MYSATIPFAGVVVPDEYAAPALAVRTSGIPEAAMAAS